MNRQADWRPTASIDVLRKRAGILQRIRQFFDSRDFFEVQTACLSRDVVVDRYVEPLPVTLRLPRGEQQFWLQTSPEFAMKRLMAAGADAIYQIGPAFRADELGDHHNLEFTMLEWYRAGDDYPTGIDLLDEFAQFMLGCEPAVRLSYREAYRQFADVDPFAGSCDADALGKLMAARVEPALRSIHSAIIHDWPADQAALAGTRIDNNGREVAERFELYIDGVELANGYHELLDPDQLMARNLRVNQLRKQDGRRELPADSRLLEAMRAGLPPSCGVALGVDRLVMLALRQTSVRSVMPFDTDHA